MNHMIVQHFHGSSFGVVGLSLLDLCALVIPTNGPLGAAGNRNSVEIVIAKSC